MTSVSRRVGAVFAVTAFTSALSLGSASAETRLHARYAARLANLPLTFATGSLKATIPERGPYSVDLAAWGMGFKVTGQSLGAVGGADLQPSSAAIDTRDSQRASRSIRIAMASGTVRSTSVTPPIEAAFDRVPITGEHRRGVVDPISAMLMPLQDGVEPTSPAACNRTIPVYEGTERFDLRLSFLRTETVRTPRGYSGPVIVCRALYRAVAGHRPNRKQVEFMEQNRTMEVWLAPISGTRMLAPWKVVMGTQIGMLVIEASQFVAGGADTAKADGDPLPGEATGGAGEPASETAN